jgi:serpin B
MKFCLLLALGVAALPVAIRAADFDVSHSANQLGLDLFRELSAGSTGNLALSPYSIESALALAYVGADGTTRDEMARALHLPPETADVQAAFARLRSALDQAAQQSRFTADARRQQGGKIDVIEWHAANRLFGQQGYAFRDTFLTLMKDGFGAPFEPLDFRRNAEKARASINAWVEDQTRQRIRDLVPPGALVPETSLVLVNALYLKAPWQKTFPKNATQPRPFHFVDGSTRDVPTMQLTTPLAHAAEDGLTVVALDYLGGDLQCLILLPPDGQPIESLATRLTPDDLARWSKLGAGGRKSVALYLPKFRVEGTTLPLGRTLRQLGMKSAFDEPPGSANFDRIAPRKPNDYLAISEVFHQTFVALDEEGTEAAASTAVAMVALTAIAEPQRPLEVRVDRPFLFAIQHRASGTCLFLGRVTDPR